MPTPKCDKCDKDLDLDNDAVVCFRHSSGEAYMCEPCDEEVKEEFINENRTTNTDEFNF
jgi:hypothetical protein